MRRNGRYRLCCYIGSSELGGMESSVATLLKYLNSDYDVIVLGTNETVVNTIAQARPDASTVIIPKVLGKMDLRGIITHIEAIRKSRPDVVLASLAQLYDAQYGLLASIVNRIPVIAIVHSVLPSATLVQRTMFRMVSARVAALAGVSRAVCRESEDALGLSRGKFSLLYNGVEEPPIAQFPPMELRSYPLLGAVGRLVPEKGFDVLIRSLTGLPGCHLAILGEGPELGNLQLLAREMRVEDRVTFVGWVNPPWSAQWRFDVLVAPSKVEGFGLVVVEAMLADIPVVGTKVGGIEEIISQDKTGIMVPVGDQQAIQSGVRRLLQDRSFRTRVTEHAHEDAKRRFSPEAMASGYENLIAKVLNQVPCVPDR